MCVCYHLQHGGPASYLVVKALITCHSLALLSSMPTQGQIDLMASFEGTANRNHLVPYTSGCMSLSGKQIQYMKTSSTREGAFRIVVTLGAYKEILKKCQKNGTGCSRLVGIAIFAGYVFTFFLDY